MLGVVALVVVPCLSCDRSGDLAEPPDPEVATVSTAPRSQAEALSPTETVERVHQLRIAGRIEQLETYRKRPPQP